VRDAVHFLSLLDHESGLARAQMAVANGSEEKTDDHKSSLRAKERFAVEAAAKAIYELFLEAGLTPTAQRRRRPHADTFARSSVGQLTQQARCSLESQLAGAGELEPDPGEGCA
jgi:hypothetical protein